MRKDYGIPIRMERAENLSPDNQLSIEKRTIQKPFKLHCHDFLELEVILNGEGINILNGQEFLIYPGSFYLMTPADFHSVIPKSERIEYYNIMFSQEWMNEKLTEILFSTSKPYAGIISGEMLESIAVLLRRMEAEFINHFEGRNLILHDIFDVILFDLLRSIGKGTPIDKRKSEEIQNAIRYLDLYFRTPVSLNQVSRYVFLSPTYFSTKFKETIGQTFSEYLNNRRLDYARNLLQVSDANVDEIAHYSGFRTTEHFIRLFKKKYGQSPGAFRKKKNN